MKKKRITALLLMIALLVSMFPTTAIGECERKIVKKRTPIEFNKLKNQVASFKMRIFRHAVFD